PLKNTRTTPLNEGLSTRAKRKHYPIIHSDLPHHTETSCHAQKNFSLRMINEPILVGGLTNIGHGCDQYRSKYEAI
ncbi:MAG: hypothetical protein ACFNX2_05295, partial [Porphyromonas pasteri]